MKTRREAVLLFGGGLALSAAGDGWATASRSDAPVSVDGLPRVLPRDAGVNPDAVIAYLDDVAASGFELNSFMLHRGGGVAAEGWWWPYRPELTHMLHSATKSFVGAGVGMAAAEGLLRLDDPVLSFFPKRVAAPSANLSAMTVESLLTQTSGHAMGISGSEWRPIQTSWIDEFFKAPVVYAPGEFFAYSSATSYMLSAIISKVSGMPLASYLKPRLFDPMAMGDVRWDVGPENINPGGNGLSTPTASFLKLGLLHLRGGEWAGRSLLPTGWVREATSAHHGNPYGYQWWVAPDDLGFFAAGKFGQFCFVFPKHDAVLAMTAGVADSLATREAMHALAFKHIGAICDGAGVASGGKDRLTEKERGLRALPVLRPQTSPMIAEISGRTFRCAPNADGVETLRLTFSGDLCRFEMRDRRGVHIVDNGLADWREGRTTITGSYLHHEYQPDVMRVVAGASWGEPNRLDLTWQFIETGFRDQVSLTFDGDRVRYDRSVNVNSGPLARPTIIAIAA